MLEKSTSIELTIKNPFVLQEQTKEIALQQDKTFSSIIHCIRVLHKYTQESNGTYQEKT